MLKGRHQNTQEKQTLKDPAGKQKLHEDYVLAPADKAGNNVISICKQYYKEILTKELTNNSGASTYLRCNETVDQIIDSHVDFMRCIKYQKTSLNYQAFIGCLSYIRTLMVIGL